MQELGELALRFGIGGAVVSVFAVLGDAFKPRTFSGLFAAAPSVALASLSLSFANEGGAFAAKEARSMVIGAIALLAYGFACEMVAARKGLPVWQGAGAAWAVWFAVAFALMGATGLRR